MGVYFGWKLLLVLVLLNNNTYWESKRIRIPEKPDKRYSRDNRNQSIHECSKIAHKLFQKFQPSFNVLLRCPYAPLWNTLHMNHIPAQIHLPRIKRFIPFFSLPSLPLASFCALFVKKKFIPRCERLIATGEEKVQGKNWRNLFICIIITVSKLVGNSLKILLINSLKVFYQSRFYFLTIT